MSEYKDKNKPLVELGIQWSSCQNRVYPVDCNPIYWAFEPLCTTWNYETNI